MAMRRDAGYLKSQRLKKISKEIAKRIQKGVDLKGLLNWIEYEIGLTRGKAREYVDLLCELNAWKIQRNKIVLDSE